MHPRLDTVAADAYRYVALNDNAAGTGVIASGKKLCVEEILHIIYICDAVAVAPAVVFNPTDVIDREFGPVLEAGRPVLVAQQAERGVGREPMGVRLNENAELLRRRHLTAAFVVELAEIGLLHARHGLIVAVAEGIELAPATVVRRHALLVRELAGGLKVDIMGMEGVDGNGVVGIGVGPSARLSGVVNRQDLYHFHSRLCRPVDHPPQIAEIADAIGVLAAQGEDRHDHSGHTPDVFPDTEDAAVEHEHLAVGDVPRAGTPVVTLLPCREGTGGVVDDDILIFQRQEHAHHVDRQRPHRPPGIFHPHIARDVPPADRRMASADGQCLSRFELGSGDAENDCAAEERRVDRPDALTAGTAGGRQIGVGVQMALDGNVAPRVRKDIILRRVAPEDALHAVPLAPQDFSVGVLDLIAVAERGDMAVARLHDDGLQRPLLPVVGDHREFLPLYASVAPVIFQFDM